MIGAPEITVPVKCEEQSCATTGIVTFVLGGLLGAFVGMQVGSLVGAYQVETRRARK